MPCSTTWLLIPQLIGIRVTPLPKKCGAAERGHEDVAGAMEIGASGEPEWREEVSA